jgi:hypothetical protein
MDGAVLWALKGPDSKAQGAGFAEPWDTECVNRDKP